MRNRLGLSFRLAVFAAAYSLCSVVSAQDTPAKPVLHVIGPIVTVSPDASTVTVKADKDGQQYTFGLANTKTLLKVPPGAKDLKSAARITGQDLQAGDRVDVRYSDADSAANPIPARSLLLMSARELQQAHQQEAMDWQNSTSGSVKAVDPSFGALTVQVRSTAGPKSLTVHTTPETTFTRYSAEHPGVPDKSSLADIRVGDQVRVIGDTQEDAVNARKIYSGSFRSVPATIVSVDSAANQLEVRDLRNKQILTVTVTPETTLRKLPPMVAAGIAHRVNAAQGSGAAGSPNGQPSGPSQAQAGAAQGGSGSGGWHGGGGDPSRMLEHMPAMSLADLKPGDAVLLTVAETKDPARAAASAVIAGVEPIFQSAPPQQGRSFSGGDWSLDVGIPAQ